MVSNILPDQATAKTLPVHAIAGHARCDVMAAVSSSSNEPDMPFSVIVFRA